MAYTLSMKNGAPYIQMDGKEYPILDNWETKAPASGYGGFVPTGDNSGYYLNGAFANSGLPWMDNFALTKQDNMNGFVEAGKQNFYAQDKPNAIAAAMSLAALGGVAAPAFAGAGSGLSSAEQGALFNGLGDTTADIAAGQAAAGSSPGWWDAIKTGAGNLFGGSGGSAAGAAGKSAGGLLSGGWGQLGAAALGALAGGTNGSKQAGTTTTTQEPWAAMQPYMLAAGQQAANIYGNSQNMPQQTQDVLNQANSVIQSQMNNGLYNQTQNVAGGLMNGAMPGVSIPGTFSSMRWLDPSQAYMSQLSGQVNPYVDKMAESITNQVNRNTMENVMPAIRSGAQSSGQYGSSRQGIAEGLAASRAQQDIGSSLSNLYGSAFENAQNRQAQAASQLGSMGVSNAQNNNTQRLNQINAGANLWNQGNNTQNTSIQNALGLANYPTDYQWKQLQNYSGLINPMAGMGGQTSTPYYTNPTSSALGGALAGAQVYKNIFG